jgi:uncharacterized membrane protein YhaH (DUF805 family)
MIKLAQAANIGTIAGLISFSIFFLLSLAGANALISWNYLICWIAPIWFIISIKRIRDREMEGFISYWEAFRSVMLSGFFFASLYSAMVYLYVVFVDPGMFDGLKEIMLVGMEKLEGTVSSSMYDKMLEGVDELTIATFCQGKYVNNLIWMLLCAFILAGIVRKNRDLFSDPTL